MAPDYAQISRDFMRALRGRRSQAAFSRRLGYRTNVAYAWESGRAAPTAATAFEAASRVGISVEAAFARFFQRAPSFLGEYPAHDPRTLARLLDDLRGRTSIVDLARVTNRSRFQVARWLSGAAEPRLPDFFLLLEKASLRLLDFISAFTDPSTLPSTAEAWTELEAARRAAYDVPWTQAVLRVLELTEYRALGKHERGFIARRIGIPLAEELRCLELLSRTGQIRKRKGLWEPRQVLSVDTRKDPSAELRVKGWWTEVSLERLRGEVPGIFSYNVFAVSQSDFTRINDLYRAYFRQIRSIIAASEPSERVVLASMQLVPLDAPVLERGPSSPA